MSDSSSSDFEMGCTPPELRVAAEEVTANLLPQISKGRYERAYLMFKKWAQSKGAVNCSESVLLAYFSEQAQTKKASTLWSTYSMLKATLNLKENLDVTKFKKLLAFLKQKNVGYSAKKSNILTRANINDFLNAPIEFLPQKVALVLGISGACRSDELFKMKTTDLHLTEQSISVLIPNTKTHRPRSFIITQPQWIGIIKLYLNLRQEVTVEGDRLFLQYRHGKITRQPLGHNSISSAPKIIAKFLNLPDINTYTGHCFRRSAATLLANTGGDMLQLKKLGGWKSSTVAEGYVETSLEGQRKIAGLLSSRSTETSQADSSPSVSLLHDVQTPPAASTSSTSTSFPLQDFQTPAASIPSTSTFKSFNFSTEQTRHGLSLTVNTHDQSNVTINFK